MKKRPKERKSEGLAYNNDAMNSNINSNTDIQLTGITATAWYGKQLGNEENNKDQVASGSTVVLVQQAVPDTKSPELGTILCRDLMYALLIRFTELW